MSDGVLLEPAVIGAIRRDAEALADDLRAVRRHIHAHPELSGAEVGTAALVTERLIALDVATRRVGVTGVVGIVRGARRGPAVALRADMDALPLMENTRVDYASTFPGVMHACGHDAHVSCLLGAARLLVERREALAGDVVLLFQPAEETDG